jgi:hypothetical protein
MLCVNCSVEFAGSHLSDLTQNQLRRLRQFSENKPTTESRRRSSCSSPCLRASAREQIRFGIWSASWAIRKMADWDYGLSGTARATGEISPFHLLKVLSANACLTTVVRAGAPERPSFIRNGLFPVSPSTGPARERGQSIWRVHSLVGALAPICLSFPLSARILASSKAKLRDSRGR